MIEGYLSVSSHKDYNYIEKCTHINNANWIRMSMEYLECGKKDPKYLWYHFLLRFSPLF